MTLLLAGLPVAAATEPSNGRHADGGLMTDERLPT
jgi:hypothetical protein